MTLGEQHQGVLSDEDVTEVWLAAKSEAISKVKRTKGGAKGAEALSPGEKEVEKNFWKSIVERQNTPILKGLNTLAEERGWVVGWWKFYL